MPSDSANEGKGVVITFHVTSVVREDDTNTDCKPSECSSKKITVEGYVDKPQTSNRISYVLSCYEYLAFRPTAHISVACAELHANQQYDARLFNNVIGFWPDGSYQPPPVREFYNIISESEITTMAK